MSNIRALFLQLHAVRHGMEALVYSNHPREAQASSYLAIIFVLLTYITQRGCILL